MKNKKIFLLVVFLSILFITSLFIFKEPFTTEEKPIRDQINAIITQFNETLCPAIKVVLDNYKIPSDTTTSQIEETEEEKTLKAQKQFEKDLGSPLFPCPPPEDPVQLPADIDKRILAALNYFVKELPKMKEKIVGALNNCNPNMEKGFTPINESFQDICPPPIGKTSTPPPRPDQQKGCINIYDAPEETKLVILKARFDALSRLLENPETPALMAKVKFLTQELLETKRRAENMELQPSCS